MSEGQEIGGGGLPFCEGWNDYYIVLYIWYWLIKKKLLNDKQDKTNQTKKKTLLSCGTDFSDKQTKKLSWTFASSMYHMCAEN